jgi:hypothetical protein
METLHIHDNTHLEMSVAATLVRSFSGLGEPNATIRHERVGDVDSNIKISGGVIRTNESQYDGKHLVFIKSRYVTIQDVRFAGVYGDWNASFRDCEDVVVSRRDGQRHGANGGRAALLRRAADRDLQL